MSGDRDLAGLRSVFELPVTAHLFNEPPPVLLNDFDGVADLHDDFNSSTVSDAVKYAQSG